MSGKSRSTPLAQTSGEGWIVLGLCLLLIALVWLVFGQASGFEFVNFDDADNVHGNPHVTAGLSWHGVVWAFAHSQVGRWAPLTTLSHMADCQFFGLRPGGHHLTNIMLHALAAVLLFLVLRELTATLWRSAFVAAAFAVHPLRAEVVMWVSARGDLLAAVFFMLALLAYARYARRAGAGAWPWAVSALFALGLMCKPTIVMLPFVLLLLDYWPLGRFTKVNDEARWPGVPKRLVIEKIPLFALALASAVVAALAQRVALTPIENLPLPSRIGNALVSCAIYLWQTIWPTRLAAFYPHPKQNLAWWQVAAALLLLGTVSVAVYAGRRRFRYATVGWCW